MIHLKTAATTRSQALSTIASDCATIVHRLREINQLAQHHGLALDIPPEKTYLELISRAAVLKHTPPASNELLITNHGGKP